MTVVVLSRVINDVNIAHVPNTCISFSYVHYSLVHNAEGLVY